MLKKRIYIALLSAIIFSLLFSYLSYTPIAAREPNSWYESFGASFQVYLLFFIPAYLLGGVPISLYINKHLQSEIIKLPIYLLGGFLVGVTTILISFMTLGLELLKYGLVGSFASLLFYILMILTKRFN